MMKLTKSSRAFRRATAVALAFALTVSAPVANNASAASKKVPTLSAKKKTLYVKGGTKSFTLKVNKNKVKKLTNTKWTTSKKSVAKISKKKTASVKVTAVKKGTATIKGVVTYKVGKKTKKKTLTCKVTVKANKATVTAAPATEAPATSTPDATATGSTVTATPAAQVATSIKVTAKDDVKTIGTAENLNKATLAADVLDADGKSMETQPEVTWASSDEAIATVKDGVVTGVKEGKATITATVKDTEIKAEYEITVDATAPKIEKSEITDYKTITLTFSEAVTGTPVAEVYKDGSRNALAGITAKLAEDGKTLTVESEAALAGDADYEVKVKDVTDAAKNPIGDKASVTLKKAKSQIKDLVVTTPNVPAPTANAKTKVYYTVKDQYGEAFDTLTAAKLTATAETEAGYPITATAKNNVSGRNYIELDYAATMVEGKTITISYTNKVSNSESYGGKATVTLVKNEGVGVPTAIEKFTVSDAAGAVVNKGTATAAEYTADSNTAKNKFNLNISLLDKFGYPTESTKQVTYVISNTSVLTFDGDTEGTVKSKTFSSSTTPSISLRGAGEATIKAYLENNDTVSATISVKVNTAALTSISIDKDGIGTKKNGTDTYYKVTLNPDGKTGLTLSDLDYVITKGDDVAKAELVAGYKTDTTHVYLKVTPAANGKANVIDFAVYAKATGSYDATTKKWSKDTKYATASLTSSVDTTPASIEVTPFEDQTVTVGASSTTTLVVKNASGEDITSNFKSNDIKIAVGPDEVANVTYEYKDGKGVLTATGKKEGTAKLVLSHGIVYAESSVTVYAAAKISKVEFSTSAVSVINNDTYKDNADTTTALVDGKVYKLVQPTFYNQFTKKMTVSAARFASDLKFAAAKAYGNNYVLLTKNGNAYEVATGNKSVDMIGIYAEFEENTANAANLTSDAVFKLTSKDEKTDFARLNVTATAARALKEITVSSAVTTVVEGQSLKLTFAGKDQYGVAKTVDASALTARTSSDDAKYADGVVSSAKAGSYTVTFTDDTTKTSFDYNFTVVNATAVDKIVIQPTVKSNGVDYNSASYKVKVAADGVIAANVKAYVGTTEVAIDNSKITYTYEATPAKDSALALTGDTVTAAGAGTVKISATQTFSTAKIDAVTINVDNAAAVATTNTSFTTLANNVYTNITSVTAVKGTATEAKDTVVYLHATDQYGKDFLYNVSTCALIGAPAGNTVTGTADGKITITSAKDAVAGSATLRVVIGTTTYDIPVTIA